uniref:Uncharacterized protein n=1 Tax=Glossina pallidipes TaxID=7398 RepID=A0A1A9ZXC2_GLOPL
MKNYYIICLGLILAIQHCVASPIPDDEQIDEHNKLYIEVLKDLTEFALKTGNELREYVTKVVDEIEQNNDKYFPNHRVEKLVKNYEKVKNSESNPNIMDLYELTGDIIDFATADFAAKDEEAKKFIEKYKLVEFSEKIREAVTKFYNHISEEFDTYAHELDETQKQEQQKLVKKAKMKNYYIICLGLILAIQHCVTSPIPDDEQIDEHNKLYIEVLKDLTEFALKTGDELREYVTKVVAEIEENNELPDKDHHRQQDKFIKSFEKVKNSEGNPDIMDLYTLTGNIIDFATDEIPVKDEQAKKLIEKYKLVEFSEKIRGAVTKFYDHISEEFDTYAHELDETQKQEQQKLFDWHKDFTGTNEIKEKFNEIVSFFELFKPTLVKE